MCVCLCWEETSTEDYRRGEEGGTHAGKNEYSAHTNPQFVSCFWSLSGFSRNVCIVLNFEKVFLLWTSGAEWASHASIIGHCLLTSNSVAITCTIFHDMSHYFVLRWRDATPLQTNTRKTTVTRIQTPTGPILNHELLNKPSTTHPQS